MSEPLPGLSEKQPLPPVLPRKRAGLFLLAGLLAFLLAGGAVQQAIRYFLAPLAPDSPRQVIVVVPRAATAPQIGRLLEEQGIIRSGMVFRLYARWVGADASLQAGEYSLGPAQGLPEIVRRLREGRAVSYTFTVPEGWNLRQIAALLDEKGLAEEEAFLRVAAEGRFDFPFLAGLPEGPRRLEGFLFPDTYQVSRGMDEQSIITMMLRRFQEVYRPLEARAQSMGMSTLEVVTLASIIEREAKKDEERPLISAVFHNRLRRGMRLESCATVQYALGTNKENLTLEDLQVDSPYNTYRNDGLPPGPIASPGKASLEAALWPADVDYLYFVAKPDGSHAFSRTLAEHDAAKRRYQR